MPKAQLKTIYSVHPGVIMMQAWEATLPEKTGRSLAEWVKLVKKSNLTNEAERRDWLKREYKLGTNASWWIAERVVGKGLEDSSPEAYLQAAEAWVEAMFTGNKAGLKQVYDEVVKLALKLGQEVKVCPCKTIVPFYRNHVFGQLKASTRTRLDLGLALRGMPVSNRLISTGGLEKGDRITHRIPLGSPADIDQEVNHWLKAAYDLDFKK